MSILSPSASTTAHQLAAVAAAASAMTSLDQVSSQFMPKCPLCDKTFANTSNLKHHMNTIHFNEAKWICNECGKVCTSKSNLKVHLRVHLRVKPYYCRWCDYNCMHHSSIRDHLSKCHPEKAHNSCEPGYIFNSAAVPEPELSTFESTYGSTFKALEEEAAAAAAAAAVAHANNGCEKQLISNKIDSGNFQDADDGEMCRNNKQFQAVSSFKFKKKLLKKHQQQFNLKRKFMSYSMSTSSYPDACGNANNNHHDDPDNSDDNNLIDGSDDNNNNNGGSEMVNDDDDGNVYMADSYQTYREEDADETYENGGSVGKKLNSSFSNLDVQNLNSYYKNNNTTNNNTESSNNLNKAANLILASNALLQGGSQNNSNGNNNMNLNSLAATFLQQLTNSAAYGIFQQYNLLSASSPSSLVANLQSMAALQQQQQQAQQQQQQHNQQASNFAAGSAIKKEPLKFTNSKGSSILSDSASSGTQGSTNKTMEELNSPSSSSSSASSPPPLSPAGSSTYSSSASSSTTSVNQGLVKNGGGLMLLKNATVKLNQKAISEVIKRLNGSKELPTGNEAIKKEDESSGGESSSSSSGVHGDDYDDVGDNDEMNNATHVSGSDNCGQGGGTTNGTTENEVDMMMMMRGDANCSEGPELVPGDDSTSGNSYKCKFCNIIFNEYSLYSIHAGMHADGANPWKCKVCGHVCTNKVDFSVHILHLSKI